jgi:ABC-type glycerol-3-phosphate transport system substrate-binding protein
MKAITTILSVLLVTVVTACGPTVTPVGDNPLEGTATPDTLPTPTVTPIPTLEATPQETDNLTIWLPDVLFPPSNNDESVNPLIQQIIDFSEASDTVNIEVRRKQLREIGGIMPTLRTAQDVAPGVLPDLTLIRREDLLIAVQESLIQPLEGNVSTAIIGDMFTTGLDLGQVDGTLYALPYALDIQHVIYSETVPIRGNASLDQYLEQSIPFIFPASRANGLNAVFLSQYLATMPLSSDSTALEVEEASLLRLYQFYEQAVANGLISSEVRNYERAADYRGVLTSGDFGSAVVSSQLYLDLVLTGQQFDVASIPTLDGEPATTVDGWMWVMTTTNPNRRALAGEFIDWMMDADRQGEYVQSIARIPSQRTALRRWYSEDYATFVQDIMPNATLPNVRAGNSATGRAIQSGLVSVISGERTAEEATQDVLSQLTG